MVRTCPSVFFFSSRRRHTRWPRDWSSDVCSSDLIGKRNPVVRTMPNTSATIGLSATAMCKGTYATDEHITEAKKLFESIGTVSVVTEEKMHIVTGLSGSGPAYIYYMVEAMYEAAEAEGLDVGVAKQLITQTIIGAGNMLQASEESPKSLREHVTSPNGT